MNIFESIKKNIPNAITCMNLLCGSVACIMALRYKEEVWWGIKAYEAAFIMIALAAVFDFFDGFVARLLHVVSAIGKELDSLCDCVSFGLAPALLVYAAMNHSHPESMLCYAALLIPVLGAVRLANFNVDTRQTTSFIGMPIPANAIFWIGFISWYANNTRTSSLKKTTRCISSSWHLSCLYPLLTSQVCRGLSFTTFWLRCS